MNYKNVKNPFDLFLNDDDADYDVMPESNNNDNKSSKLFNIVFVIVQIMVILLAAVGIVALTYEPIRQELTNIINFN